jgi:hypothetical protein
MPADMAALIDGRKCFTTDDTMIVTGDLDLLASYGSPDWRLWWTI